MVDPRKVVGNTVQTKATFVTHLSECSRRFGSLAKTKLLDGVVTEVEVVRNPTTNRSSTLIHANWILDPNTIKPRVVNVRNITYTPPPPIPLPANEIAGQQEGFVSENPDVLVTTTVPPADELPGQPPTVQELVAPETQ